MKETLTNCKNKIITFDADGILIHSAIPVLHQLNKLCKSCYEPSDINNWDFVTIKLLESGLNNKDAEKFSENTWFNSEVLSKAPPVWGSWTLSRRLELSGARQHVITSRRPYLNKCTINWFKIWMPWITEDNIHIRNSNCQLSGAEFKAYWVNRLKSDIHFEDSHQEAQHLLGNTEAQIYYLPYSDYKETMPKNRRLHEIPRVNGNPNMWRAYQMLVNNH